MPNPEINPLSQEDIDNMFEQEAGSISSEKKQESDFPDEKELDELADYSQKKEVLKNISPEKIAQEWDQLSDMEKKFVTSSDDETFNQIVEKRRGQSRKADIMILMRRIKKNNKKAA